MLRVTTVQERSGDWIARGIGDSQRRKEKQITFWD